jgi:succinate dehydrogenase/fumarate reductase iron-sulfur protein
MGLKLKIFRFDPQKDEKPYYQTFIIDAQPTDRLLDCLNRIRWEQDPTLSFRMSCAHGVCGSDGMRINGICGLPCQKLVKDFKDEVTILKDLKDIRVEVKIENKAGKAFCLTIMVKQRQTQKIIKDLRVTLLKDDLELESYLTDSGSVTFEHLLLGSYTIEVVSTEDKLASILLDIKT